MENERLRKENEKLTAELTRTKAALEVVGKAHALLELLSESGTQTRSGTSDRRRGHQAGTFHLGEKGVRAAGKSRATLHRQRNPEPAAEKAPPGPRAPHPAASPGPSRPRCWPCWTASRPQTSPPAQVYAILLDDGIYLASIRTMYRVMTLADQFASAAPRPPIRPGSALSWSLTARTRSGPGTSPN